MSFNTPDSSAEFNQKTESLTKAQQDIVDRVLAQLDTHPEIGVQIGLDIAEVYHAITHAPGKLDRFLTAIESAKQAKLDAITKQFDGGKLSGELARTQAHDIITHYGHLTHIAFQDTFKSATLTA